MLTSLLPGLREVRGPLTVGYLWLLALWLAFPDWLPELAKVRPFADISRVLPLVGEGVVLSLVTFLAYLIGAFLYVDIQARAGGLLQGVFHPKTTPVSAAVRRSLETFTQYVVSQAIGSDMSARGSHSSRLADESR